MAKKKSWGLIILGIVILVVIVGVGVVATAGFIIYRQFAPERSRTTSAVADQRFADISKRFEGEKPYIEIQDERPVINHDTEKPNRTDIDALHVLAWDPDKRETFRINIPFWLVRLGGSQRTIQLGDHRESRRLKITAADIERHGPGLILDYTDRDGQRVLVWAQ